MTTDEEKIKVMQAFINGAKIEYCYMEYPCTWHKCSTPTWNWSGCYYRVVQEPKEEKVGYVAVLKSRSGTLYVDESICPTEEEILTCGFPNLISVAKITYTI